LPQKYILKGFLRTKFTENNQLFVAAIPILSNNVLISRSTDGSTAVLLLLLTAMNRRLAGLVHTARFAVPASRDLAIVYVIRVVRGNISAIS